MNPTLYQGLCVLTSGASCPINVPSAWVVALSLLRPRAGLLRGRFHHTLARERNLCVVAPVISWLANIPLHRLVLGLIRPHAYRPRGSFRCFLYRKGILCVVALVISCAGSGTSTWLLLSLLLYVASREMGPLQLLLVHAEGYLSCCARYEKSLHLRRAVPQRQRAKQPQDLSGLII
jgi:hypothetical protein